MEEQKDESVDLIYLDPPFNSKATYNVLFAEQNGTQSQAQIKAFDDTWHWGMESEEAFHELVTEGPGKLPDLMDALRRFLGTNDMMAYLAMMAIRLVELRRVLKATGSIYLHCDPTASHYLKLVMDAVFGGENFRNEIIWAYEGSTKPRKAWDKKHEVLLFYSKSDRFCFNASEVGDRRKESSLKAYEGMLLEDENGRFILRYRPAGGFAPKSMLGDPRVYKSYIREYIYPKDWWVIDYARKSERLGYPTQKPEALLERIIRASSNEGDLVLDPFCGCGTTIAVAERLKRRWIGIDSSSVAIELTKQRLEATGSGR